MKEDLAFAFFIGVFLYRFGVTSGLCNKIPNLFTGNNKCFDRKKKSLSLTSQKETKSAEAYSVENVEEKASGEHQKVCIYLSRLFGKKSKTKCQPRGKKKAIHDG